MTQVGNSLSGRKGVLTGGAGGIGRATAMRLARDGAHVFIFDKRENEAQKVVDEIREAGGVADCVHCDVTEESDVIAAFEVAKKAFGSIDYFVGVAGALDYGETHELELHAWQKMLDINLTGMFLSCKHALRSLLENGSGSIVTISSVASMVERVGDRAASYGVTKAGVVALTRSIAVNYAERGIRANCICPGAVATNLSSVNGTPRAPIAQALSTRSPLQRMADPTEVAGAVSYLVSDDASFVTGSTMVIDGGLTAV